MTRAAIADPLPTLFVFGGQLPDAIREELLADIERRRSGAPFALNEWLQPAAPPTDPSNEWQGDHQFWQRKLAAIRLEDPSGPMMRFADAIGGQFLRARKNLLRPPLAIYDG
jgi:hypothetical protein